MSKAADAPAKPKIEQRSRDRAVSYERAVELLAYDADTGILSWTPKGLSRRGIAKNRASAGYKMTCGYIAVQIDGLALYGHRLAWLLHHRKWPAGEIDHINSDRSDNRLVNLRAATRSQNGHNIGITGRNRTGFKGVHICKSTGRFRAMIRVENSVKHLGYFDTAEAAAACYQATAAAMVGDFARG